MLPPFLTDIALRMLTLMIVRKAGKPANCWSSGFPMIQNMLFDTHGSLVRNLSINQIF
jgi:hypothetical protein